MNWFPFFADCNTTTFMATYRSPLPDQTVFPKLHYLKDHLIPFVKKWHVGPGIFGEHGGETLHSLFKQLAERRFAGTKPKLTRLEQLMTHFLLQANPVTKAPPEPQRRKAKQT